MNELSLSGKPLCNRSIKQAKSKAPWKTIQTKSSFKIKPSNKIKFKKPEFSKCSASTLGSIPCDLKFLNYIPAFSNKSLALA